MHPILAEAERLFEFSQSLRRDFHRNPELGFEEKRTSEIIVKELKSLEINVKTGIAKTGVLGSLEGKHPGPVVMLRFDMDALPVSEETGADYQSQKPGVMHACGHDGHMAIGLTVAHILKLHQEELHGTVQFVFQPAEEGLGGADVMIKEGILEDPKPDYALGMHLWNEKPLGWIGVGFGPVMAAAEIFKIKIKGKGGHGAVPDLAVDPVIAAANVITSVQSIVSRNVSPLNSAVISITSVHGGETFNVIPPVVEMQGTIRTFSGSVRELVIKRFLNVVEKTAEAYNCVVEIDTNSISEAVVNEESVAKRVLQIAEEVLPYDDIDTDFRTMGSEDMASILSEVPGCYMFFGCSNQEKGLNAPHHHPKFDFDEKALSSASAVMAATVFDFLAG